MDKKQSPVGHHWFDGVAHGSVAIAIGIAIVPLSAAAQDRLAGPDASRTPSDVVVTGVAQGKLQLDSKPDVSSRAGLSVRETPAEVNTITQAEIIERGARDSVEALNAVPGVVAANLPSIPGTTSIRGFTGDAVSQLYDGVRQPFMRDFDSWSFDRIEVLKGPASVLYGEGALAGAINFVPKRPTLGGDHASGLLSYGSFDTLRAAGDVDLTLAPEAGVRAVASYSRASGYVDGTESRLFAATLAGRLKPSDRLTVDVAADFTHDRYDTANWGEPLVPASIARQPTNLVTSTAANAPGYVIDRALRNTNFEFANSVERSRTIWLRSNIAWQAAGWLKLTNELDYYDAKRRWRDSESYSFSAATGLLNRSTTRIDHDNTVLTERFLASSDANIAGLRNRASVGVEYSHTSFSNPRSFGTGTPVDPYAVQRGVFPDLSNPANFPGAGNRVGFDTSIDTLAFFGEDALNLTKRLLLVGGLRYDKINLHREVDDFNLATVTTFGQRYHPISWRVGAVYSVTPTTQLYAQYNRAVAPVGSLALISLASSRFDLTTGRTVEAGVKSTLFGRLDLMAAGYRIKQDNIVTRDPNNFTLSVQGGSQSSRGFEASASYAITGAFRLDGGYSHVVSRFDTLLEAGGANRAGNTPPFVSRDVGNLFGIYRPTQVPLTFTAGVRSAGHFFTDNANLIRVRGYTVADASVGYRTHVGDLTVRVRNVFDEFYATWRGGSTTQLIIAPPRSVDVALTTRF